MKLTEIQKIKENLQVLAEAEQFLIEHLGNLDFINKQLMKVLWKTGSESKGVKDGLGRDSEIKVQQVSNGTKAWELFTTAPEGDVPGTKKNKPLAMMFYVGKSIEDKSNQFLIITRQSSSNDSFNLIIRGGLLGTDEAAYVSKQVNTSFLPANEEEVKDFSYISEGKARIVITNFLKSAKAKKLEANFALIFPDTKAAAKHNERLSARKGMTYTSAEIKSLAKKIGDKNAKDFVKNNKEALRDRLTKFKEGKLDQLKTVDDVIPFLKNAGYTQKIKVGKFIYVFSRERLSLESMIKPKDRWYEEPYVEYSISTDSDFYELQHKYRMALKAKTEELLGTPQPGSEATAEEKSKYDADRTFAMEKAAQLPEIKDLYVPGGFKIFLKLDKDKIVPSKIVATNN
jgi:hypothetical protein